MSDGDTITGELKDLAKETVKQAANIPKNFATGAVSQIANRDSEEDEARKKADKIATFQRIKSIEAEIAQIRAYESQKTGPQIKQSQNLISESNPITQKEATLDEASRQAKMKTELGRNYKG